LYVYIDIEYLVSAFHKFMNKFRLVVFKQDHVKTFLEGVRELTKLTGALHATRRHEMDKPEIPPTYYIPDPICQHITYAMDRNLMKFNVIKKNF
jgi:hypothetical protein